MFKKILIWYFILFLSVVLFFVSFFCEQNTIIEGKGKIRMKRISKAIKKTAKKRRRNGFTRIKKKSNKDKNDKKNKRKNEYEKNKRKNEDEKNKRKGILNGNSFKMKGFECDEIVLEDSTLRCNNVILSDT